MRTTTQRLLRVAILSMAAVGAFAPAKAVVSDDAKTCIDGSSFSDSDKKLAACTRLIEDQKTPAEIRAKAHNNRGLIWSRKKDFKSALADYDAAIRLNPRDSIFWNNRGIVHKELNKDEQAIADYTEAINLEPDYPSAYSNRGFVHYRQGRLDLALADYTATVQLEPNEGSRRWIRGQVYLYAGQADAARQDFLKAIALFRGKLDFFIPTASLWLEVANRRAGRPSELAEIVKSLNVKEWPAPLVEMFLGRRAYDAVLADAQSPQQKCEAVFYGAELALSSKDKATAVGRFEAVRTIEGCPPALVNHAAAAVRTLQAKD